MIKSIKDSSEFIIFLLICLIINSFTKDSLYAQSLPMPTDRARIHVAEITDPTDPSKKLKVLRTDANTPLRGASPWILNKKTQANDAEISASFFADQAKENLNSVRIIWFQAWFDVYARQNNQLPSKSDITDFNDPVQVKHCLEVLEAAVNNASANGMYACINFHTAWKGPINLPYAKQFWAVVAPYFANRTHVIYEQANEPVPGSGGYTASNDRGTDMNCQVELYKLIRNAAPNAFLLIMTPPSCEGDFSTNNDFIKGVKRFESLVGPVDWTKTGVGYHTYYLGWENGTFAKSSVPMRAIHRAYPAMSTEVNWPDGVVGGSNQEVSLDGEKFQIQTHERLGLGWWLWAVSHPDKTGEGWYANFNKLKSDAVAKGYFWPKDQIVPPSTVTARGDNMPDKGVANIQDWNNETQWLDSSKTSWIQIAYSQAQKWNKYTITSGSEASNDPQKWELLASKDSIVWTTLDTRDNEIFSARKSSILYNFDNDSLYSYYKLNIIANNGGNGVELSELHLFFTDEKAPTMPINILARDVSSTRATLSWFKSTDNIGVISYRIYNDTNYLVSSNDTVCALKELKSGTSYTISVSAVDASGNISVKSTPVIVNTTDYDALIPFTEVAPLIDGEKDKIYSNTFRIEHKASGEVTDSTDLSANWSVAFDNNNIYFYIKVFDDTIVKDGPEWYFDDRIEIFLDAEGNRAAAFDSKDYQYYFRPGDSNITETKKNATANTVINYKTFDGGYILELKIPLKTVGIIPKSNSYIGIDLVIADDDNGKEDDAVLVWNNNDGNTYTSPILWGLCRLGVNPDTIAPNAPESLMASKITSNSFSVSWHVANDNYTVANYNVYKNGTLLGSTSDTVFTLTKLVPETDYLITIKASDAVGNWSNLSNELKVTTSPPSAIGAKALNDQPFLYPNPASNKVLISNIKPNSNIKICSTDGKVMLCKSLINSELELNIENWNKGLYIIISNSKLGSSVLKLVVK